MGEEGEVEAGGERSRSIDREVGEILLDFQVFFISREEKGFLVKGRGREERKKTRRSYFVRNEVVDVEFGVGRKKKSSRDRLAITKTTSKFLVDGPIRKGPPTPVFTEVKLGQGSKAARHQGSKATTKRRPHFRAR